MAVVVPQWRGGPRHWRELRRCADVGGVSLGPISRRRGPALIWLDAGGPM